MAQCEWRSATVQRRAEEYRLQPYKLPVDIKPTEPDSANTEARLQRRRYPKGPRTGLNVHLRSSMNFFILFNQI